MIFSSYAKWILSGEHAVVRGGKAIAFPLRNYQCSIRYEVSDELNIIYENSDMSYNRTFFEILQKAAESISIGMDKIRGTFFVNNTIQMQSGLGSSAAICANIASIFNYLGFCDDVFSLAKHLEDKFHNKSSGLDISVAITKKPIIFQNNRIMDIFHPSFWPCFILTYSGEKSITTKCFEIVRSVFRRNSTLADELDAMMNHASDLCEAGLKESDFNKLRDGIRLGNESFKGWGL